MDIIAQNPYRVLGMFANDSLKVMTANIARIRAFSKVGKEINFDCDHVEIFGPVNRSKESIQIAISQLSDPISAKTWQLFWIHSTAEAKNCIDTESITTEAYINNAVLALYDRFNRAKEAAVYYSKVFEKNNNDTNLFEPNTFWLGEEEKSAVAKDFLNKLVPQEQDDFWLDPYKKKYEGWFWWFKTLLKPGNCLITALHIKYKGFALERLNKIAQDYDLIGPTKGKYHKVLWHAQPYLDILNTLWSYGDSEIICPEEIQLTRDRLACGLINFCELVYERSNFWEAVEVEDILNFLDNEVRRLAYVSTTINFLEKKIEELTNIIPLLAPEDCKCQSDQIKELIIAFCDKKDEVKWSLMLVRQSVKHLLQIREIAGVDNSYYKHISTKIADNAIYSADVDLSTAVRMYSNPKNDRKLAISHLLGVLRQCRLLAADIGLFNLEEDFVEGKLRSFIQFIERTAKKYGVADEEVSPDICMSSDFDLFMACGEDYQKLKEFIASHPDNQYLGQAIQKIWDIEDKAYPKQGDSNGAYRKALFEYKTKFPTSHNEEKLLNEVITLLFGSLYGSIFEYRQFIRLWPDHPKKQMALDMIERLTFLACTTIGDYIRYIDEYPQGKYYWKAGAKIIELQKIEIKKIYDQCETIADYNRFILKYPTSDLFDAACEKIEDLVFANALRDNNFAQYLNQYPNGRYIEKIKEKADDDFWIRICKSHDYSAYLRNYPNGRHSKEAKERLAKIQEEEKAKRDAEDNQYWEMSKVKKAYKVYLAKYPRGLHAKEAEDLLRKGNSVIETIKDVAAIIVLAASIITFCYLIF